MIALRVIPVLRRLMNSLQVNSAGVPVDFWLSSSIGCCGEGKWQATYEKGFVFVCSGATGGKALSCSIDKKHLVLHKFWPEGKKRGAMNFDTPVSRCVVCKKSSPPLPPSMARTVVNQEHHYRQKQAANTCEIRILRA